MAILATFVVPHPPIIIPEVGKGEERKVQATIDSYERIAKEIAEIQPETIILSSPHSTMYRDYFHVASGAGNTGNLGRFGAPDVTFSVEYDQELIHAINENSEESMLPIGLLGSRDEKIDHGSMVPLYFIQKHYKNFHVLLLSPSGLSQLDHYLVGKFISKIVPKNKKVVWVASGDLSHKLKKHGPYGLAKEGPIFDEQLVNALKHGDFGALLEFDPSFCQKAAECGLGSFTMMAGALDGYDVTPNLYSYEGTFGVGYAVASFYKGNPSEYRFFDVQYENKQQAIILHKRSNEDEYVTLARQSLEYYLNHHKPMMVPKSVSDDLVQHRAGVFVSIHKEGQLRGCIGTTRPTRKNIAEEIIRNAISAGTEDYRFNTVKPKELPKLDYSVDVLFPSEPIKSINELDVKRYGVIVRHGYKSGLLLPNLDGIDTVQEQVSIALRKAGIRESDPYKMERFEVIRHH